MATAKKSTSKKTAVSKRTDQTVASPKRSIRKKTTSDITSADIDSMESAPKTKIITKKYLYAVAGIIVVVGLLFAASRLWVVAWVDNKPITKFELFALMEKRDEGKTADELIQEKLLLSEGQKQRQSVSDAEIEAEILKVETAQGGAAQLDQILAMNRISRVDFRKLVELNLLKQKLFGGDVNITDEQVAAFLEENKASLPPEVMANPESSEAAQTRDRAKEQLKQTKINENFSKWLEEAMQSSRVMRMVPAPTPVAPATPQVTPQ